ncbi:hypothetical protein HPB47_027592 [Ixodes persulcatus]|uniref:Uncharacterized protein n=1 Tax=Ixodes persulcatus TaxID=34615 RepID=A0AC60PX66_IXOPE|nr:hypothetical protein HPB47_027592 [Ixodes persulcatus]
MKTFLAINMLMGIKKLPSYRDFWSSPECLRDPFVSRQMSIHRFGALLTSIHLNDNAVAPNRGSPGFDKLYKSIDESMIRFKGRSALKQYIPMKPIRRGKKVWTRADETGYVCQFQIYAGKADNQSSEQGLGCSGRTYIQDLFFMTSGVLRCWRLIPWRRHIRASRRRWSTCRLRRRALECTQAQDVFKVAVDVLIGASRPRSKEVIGFLTSVLIGERPSKLTFRRVP